MDSFIDKESSVTVKALGNSLLLPKVIDQKKKAGMLTSETSITFLPSMVLRTHGYMPRAVFKEPIFRQPRITFLPIIINIIDLAGATCHTVLHKGVGNGIISSTSKEVESSLNLHKNAYLLKRRNKGGLKATWLDSSLPIVTAPKCLSTGIPTQINSYIGENSHETVLTLTTPSSLRRH